MSPNDVEQVKVETRSGTRHDVRILKVTGPLTIRNFFEFQDISRRDTSRALIIDLEDVPYIDSAALGSLLGIHVSCEKNGRKYALVNVTERLEKMFSVCGVNDVLVTYRTLPEAEASLS